MKTNIHSWSHLAQFFLELETFRTKLVEEIKTHVLCSITFCFENRDIYEMMWKNIVEPDRPQMTIWHLRIACRIPKATNIHSEHVLLLHCYNG